MFFRRELDTKQTKFHIPLYVLESKDKKYGGLIFPVLTYDTENSLANDNIIFFANKFNMISQNVYTKIYNGYFIDEELNDEYSNNDVSWYSWFCNKFIHISSAEGKLDYNIRLLLILFRKSSTNENFNILNVNRIVRSLILEQECALIQLLSCLQKEDVKDIGKKLLDIDKINEKIKEFNEMILDSELDYDMYGKLGSNISLKKVVYLDDLIDVFEENNESYLIRNLSTFDLIQDLFLTEPTIQDIVDTFSNDNDIKKTPHNTGIIIMDNIIKEEGI